MNMLAFDPNRAMSHKVVTSESFAIPPKLYERSEAVVRLDSRELRNQTGEELHQN